MKKIITLALAMMPFLGLSAQEKEITTAQAKALYKDFNKARVSVHDPSVVWDQNSQRYYIFGSHRGVAYTADMQNWYGAGQTWKAGNNTNAANNQAFVTPVVKKVMKGGVEVDMPQFNAMEWAARTDAEYNINGNMWAPDVIYNKAMNKWCMYLSVNGDAWHSSIILLTADNITGPYEYQAPIVISGFDNGSHSYKDTDLELAIGTQSTLPGRYNVGNGWGNRWPNNIDPAVFYDENDNLWLVYGSWSGGIWMLELDENTGLRDYNVNYPLTGSGDGITVDPYFGKKVAGGYYVSGEGPYIEHIGNYYYLFVSYGFFGPDGGYEMRVFRSENPDGPYKDASGRSAVFTSYVMNYGTGNETRGAKIMGAYGKWGFMTTGECAQGHNSIIAANDGRTYLIYHTKFNDGNPQAGFHSVRTHQVFQNKDKWLVAAPFEYNGESITDNDIATTQLVATEEIPGEYEFIIHKYKMDYAKMEEVNPVKITLSADGKVSGSYTGTWKLEEGTSYFTLTLGSTIYKGVLIEEQMDNKTIKAVAFSAMASNGVNVWGYKFRPEYSIAWQVNNQKDPLRAGQSIMSNIDLYAQDDFTNNIERKWTSTAPEIFDEYGHFYPDSLTEATYIDITYRITSNNWFWEKQFTRTRVTKPSIGEWQTGLLAYYSFDDDNNANIFNGEEKALLKRMSINTTLPKKKADETHLRTENVIETAMGEVNKESYIEIPNPLYGKDITTSGATVSFWVQRLDISNLYGTLCGFYNPTTQARYYFTGNLYSGFNDNAGTWIDINHPTKAQRTEMNNTRWHHVMILFGQYNTTGIRVYVDGVNVQNSDVVNGSQNGQDITTRQSFNYECVKKHLSECPTIWFGKGSFWGSAKACFDDIMVYDHELKYNEAPALYAMANSGYNISNTIRTTGITFTTTDNSLNNAVNAVYDLSGRYIGTMAECKNKLKKGIYICNGKKFMVK